MYKILKSPAGQKFEPTPAEIDFSSAVNTCELLESAADKGFSADALFYAMKEIEKRARDKKRTPLTKDCRDRMLAAVMSLEQAAIDCLSEPCSEASITSGFEALTSQIHICGGSLDRKPNRSSDHLKDIFAYAKMFRNNIENVMLSGQVCARVICEYEREKDQCARLASRPRRLLRGWASNAAMGRRSADHQSPREAEQVAAAGNGKSVPGTSDSSDTGIPAS